MINRSFILIILLMGEVNAQEYQATYQLTFIGEWNSTTHPIDFPNGAHFSQLIGNTHNKNGFIWRPGEFSSMGIQFMAETGSISNLTNEINALINSGTAESRLVGSGINSSSSTSFEFSVTNSHSLVSLTTMIAPSPDWFVGIHGVNLQSAGYWVEELMIDLYAYDAGTDDGDTFDHADILTMPPVPIFRTMEDPLPNDVPIGTFVFTRLTTTGQPDDVVFVNGFEG